MKKALLILAIVFPISLFYGCGNSPVADSTNPSTPIPTPTPTLASIIVSPSSKTLSVGDNQTFTASGIDNLGNPIAITPTWSVTGGIGTITSSGVFTASTAGSGKVVVVSGTILANASVTVAAAPTPTPIPIPTPTPTLASIIVSPSSKTLSVGDNQTFTASGIDNLGNPIAITPTWSVTGGIGTISSSGVFIANTSGTGKINATSGSIVGDSSVVVNSKTVTLNASHYTCAASAMPAVALYNTLDYWCGYDGADIYITYVKFDTALIPSTATISNVTLRSCVFNVVSGPTTVLYYRAASSWSESLLTYNNRPSATGPVLATRSYFASPCWITEDLSSTSILTTVQSWVDGSVTNYGLVLIPQALGYSSHVAFLSKSGGINTPQMQITYNHF